MKKILTWVLLLLLLTSCGKKAAPITPITSTSSGTTATWTVQQTPTSSWAVNNTAQTPAVTASDTTASTSAAVVVKSGDNIEVNYTGKLEDGSVFDSSYPRKKTLPFTVGAGQMIPWFDKAVIGMKEWEKKTVTLKPAEAYGDYDPKAVIEVKRSQFKELEAKGFKIQPWVEVPTQFGPLLIKKVDGEKVMVDVNHKLAGKTLIFDIEMMKIGGPAPTPETPVAPTTTETQK
jgi:FKBP-type peptidyl-prolyl cis-trans isomerase 2